MGGSRTRTTTDVVIRNIGRVATGDLRAPILGVDTVAVQDGRIASVGDSGSRSQPGDVVVVDADGLDLIPGLIDAHIHPGFGDWSPRMGTIGWLHAYAQAGVTTAISQGSFLVEGYPGDREGMMALAVALQRSYQAFRPGRMKVHGAAISLVEELNEADFRRLASEGVRLIAEIGVHGLIDPGLVRPMLESAHRAGFVSRAHFGPMAVEGSSTVTAELAAAMGVQIASHVNGGPTAPPLADVEYLLDRTTSWLELCYTGSHWRAVQAAQAARSRGSLDRLMLGSDSPHGGGVIPRAIFRLVNLLCTFAGIPVGEAVAIGTGNAARAYRLNTGVIEPGREADLLLIDAPRDGVADTGLAALEQGDVPSVGLVMIDGEITSWQTVNTPLGKRRPRIVEAP